MTKFSFSERKKISSGLLPEFAATVNVQARRKITYAITRFFNQVNASTSASEADIIATLILDELSVKHGVNFGYRANSADLADYMLKADLPVELFLDCIEISDTKIGVIAIDGVILFRNEGVDAWKRMREDINQTLMLEGCGYQLVDLGRIVVMTSDALHTTVIEPALYLIRDSAYQSVNECYRQAVACLKAGDFKEACTNSRRALESALKVIADKQGNWVDSKGRPLSAKAQLKELIQAAFANQLLPSSWEATFNGFRPFLESTVPSVTNPPSHGSSAPLIVPEEIAEFAIASTASVIVLLVKRAKSLNI